MYGSTNNQNNQNYGYQGYSSQSNPMKLEEKSEEVIEAELIMEELIFLIQAIDSKTLIINTPQDSKQLREDVKRDRERTKILIKDCLKLLQKPSLYAHQKDSYNFAQAKFAKIVEAAKRSMTNSLSKERNFPLRVEYKLNQQALNLQSHLQYDENITDQEFDEKLKEDSELDIDNSFIRDRNQRMKGVAEDLANARQLTTDLAFIVDEQTELFQEAEDKTTKVDDQIRENYKIISIAGKAQTGSRVKKIIMVSLLICMVVTVVLIIAARLGIYAAMS